MLLSLPTSSDLEKLLAIAKNEKWEVNNVDPDGDCMFSALALQLGRNTDDLRLELVEYLRSNNDMVSVISVSLYL
jgi:hypothetical protein